MNKFMPYVLPVVSIFIILGFFLFDPSITGFFVKEPEEIGARIKVSTIEDLIIPGDAIVEVSLDGVSESITFSEFVERSGGEFEFDGGYTGNYDYSLPLVDFGFTSIREGQVITVKVYSGDWVISESEAVVPSR